MIAKKKKIKIPEINAGSMADIAFLLLIFFLVTTTIDQETGLQRKLPPKPPEGQKPPPVKERNVFVVLVNAQNMLFVNGEVGDINLLKDKIKEFIQNKNNDPDLPEKQEPQDIPGIGSYRVSKGVISLQNNRLTSYEKYMEVQDVIVRAFNEMKDELAQEKFNTTYENLLTLANSGDEDAKLKFEALSAAIPMAISESEPVETAKK